MKTKVVTVEITPRMEHIAARVARALAAVTLAEPERSKRIKAFHWHSMADLAYLLNKLGVASP